MSGQSEAATAEAPAVEVTVEAPPQSEAPAAVLEAEAEQIAVAAETVAMAADHAVALGNMEAARVVAENQDDVQWLKNRVRELEAAEAALRNQMNDLRLSIPQPSQVEAMVEEAVTEALEPETTPEETTSLSTPISTADPTSETPMEAIAENEEPEAVAVEEPPAEVAAVVEVRKRRRIIV